MVLNPPYATIATLFVCIFIGSASYIEAQCPADVNGDGVLTPADFNAWIQAFNERDLLADQNLDGNITPADFNAWISNWGNGCGQFDTVEFFAGGATSPALDSAFSRPVQARAPNGTDVGLDEPRFDSPVLRAPVGKLSSTFTNVAGGASHLGAGYAEDGQLVQFHAIKRQGGGDPAIQATHGTELTGDPAGPPPSNARRFSLELDSSAGESDWAAPPADGDTFKPSAGEYYRGAWLLVSEAVRSGRTGVAISVGNYTPEFGLRGNAGLGTRMTTVFCDLDMQTTSPNRVREWSTTRFVLRNEHEIVFAIVDYASGWSNESWAVMIRATRPDGGSPWTFHAPTVVLERAGTNLVDHFHNIGFARSSSTGLISAFISTGDVIGDQAVYVRSIADLDQAETLEGTYLYNGQRMRIAFADPPSARWNALDAWEAPTGTTSWTPARGIFGRRVEDGEASDWGAPQFVACAPGPKRSQILFGADVTYGHAVYCYDVDTFDPLTESPYPEVWQRWGASSQYGFTGVPSGINLFQLYTPTPERPEWYVGSISQTNFAGTFTPSTLLMGRATDDDKVAFAKIGQRISMQTFAMTDDGRTVFTGAGLGRTDPVTRIDFLRAPEVVKPRLIGAGFDQYQPLFAAGTTPLDDSFEAGSSQAKNTLIQELESRPGITARFATDADLAGLQSAGFRLPGFGPVYFVETDGSETSSVYLSDTLSTTLPLADSFQGPFGPPLTAQLADGMTTGELVFAVLNDPRVQPARSMPWRFSFGDKGGATPGVDYRVVPIEGCDWFVGRLPYRGNIMNGLRMRLTSTTDNGTNPGPGEVPVSFFLQIIGVGAGDDQMYPMGYAGPPNARRTAVGATLEEPLSLPDETQTISGLAPAGTIIYHGITDPHGVDVSYYEQVQSEGIFVDHAFLSLEDDPNNYVQLTWRNGITLFAEVWNGEAQPQFIDLFQSSYLQRQDDIKVAIRYETGSIVIDVWHNGNRTTRSITQRVPEFNSPVVRCGSVGEGRSMPMQLFSFAHRNVVLTSPELYRVMETGEHAQ